MKIFVRVSAINGTTVEVKFNKEVDAASLFADDKSGAFDAGVVTIKTIDSIEAGDLSGKLSEDGKTLTVTTENPVSKRYNVVVDGIKATDGSAIAKYDDIVTFAADTTAPAIVSTVKDSASTFTVTFSEPIKQIGTVTYKYADGTPITTGISNNFVAGTPTDKVTFTMTGEIAAGKTVVATLVGAQDTASNLLTPNPATVTMVKGALDGVAPTVSAITQTGATTFTVKFSEQLSANPTISINGTDVAEANVVKSTTDATLYTVTATDVLDGAKTIAVKGFNDLSGEVGTDTSKVVVFTKDAAAPKVASSTVVVDATDSKQYLEVTFDKDVKVATGKVNGTGTFVKDHITNDITAVETEVKADATNKKVVRVNLDTLLGDATDVEGAIYNLDLTFTGVTSAADVVVEPAKATFTRGKDGVPASGAVAKVKTVAQDATNNNKVNVTFDQAVDGASATNAANYKIDGAVVESVTLLPATTVDDVTTQVAVLNLKAGSNEFTGTRNINISDVKALGSTKVMEPFHTNQVTIKENVAPVVVSAKLTGTEEVTLTFSEAVADAADEDFEVLIEGKSQATAEKVNTNTGSDAVTTVKVTIAAVDADKIAKGISLKALETIDVKDAAGNVLSVPANIVVTQ